MNAKSKLAKILNDFKKGRWQLLTISILDQSPVSLGSNPREALLQTAKLAQAADQWGYKRFWVSEHHDAKSLAGSTPEVFVAHLAAVTKTIRIGSGGVMLPHYSAYKVAENFRTLEALYPNRIDLGIGRAPGGMPRATMALQEGKLERANYQKQITDLIAYVTDTVPEDHRFPGLKATPLVDTVPEIWMLGSSNTSAKIAGEEGTAFSFAHFINPEDGIQSVRDYKQSFKPSILYTEPTISVAVFVICAETDEEANLIASSFELSRLYAANRKPLAGIPTIEMAQTYDYNSYERTFIKELRKRMIVGSPSSVKEQIIALAQTYEANEVMAVTITHDFTHRLHSFDLLATVFDLRENNV